MSAANGAKVNGGDRPQGRVFRAGAVSRRNPPSTNTDRGEARPARSPSAVGRGRSGSRGRVYRECDFLGHFQLVAATPNLQRYVVNGDSRYVEVRVRRLVYNQRHVLGFMRNLCELTSWDLLPKAVSAQLQTEQERPVTANTWVYAGERYTAGAHFAAPLERLEAISRSRSASKTRQAPAQRAGAVAKPQEPVASTPVKPALRRRNRDQRGKKQVSVGETTTSDGMLAAVVAAATGLADTVVSSGADAVVGSSVGGSIIWVLMLLLLLRRVSPRAVFGAALMTSAFASAPVFFHERRAAVRGSGLMIESEPLFMPAPGGCVVAPSGCYDLNFAYWRIEDKIASEPCGFLPIIKTVACPKGCKYQQETLPYVCEATNEQCPVGTASVYSKRVCFDKRAEVAAPSNATYLQPSLFREVNDIRERDDRAGGVGLYVRVCGHRPVTLRIGAAVLPDVWCEKLRVYQDGVGTDNVTVCVDSHCESMRLRRPYTAYSVIPGEFDCDPRVGAKCTPAVWDPVRRAVVRSYNADVVMTVSLGAIGFVSFEPYSVRLKCDGAICPVARDFYGQVRFRTLGQDIGPIGLHTRECVGLCYQWRLLLVHIGVYAVLTLLFGCVFRYGTWRWALIATILVVAYSVSVGQRQLWRRIVGWVFACFLGLFALGVILTRRRPSWVKLAVVYVVFASIVIGSQAQCVGIACNSTQETIRCEIARYVRCGRALRPCPANTSSLGPYFEFAPAVCVPRDAVWDSTVVLYWSFVQRIGFGAVNMTATQKYVQVGSVWYRLDNGYLRPLSGGVAARASWLAVLLPSVVAMVINVPIDAVVATIAKQIATVGYMATLLVLFFVRLPFWRTLLLTMTVTMVYLPVALSAPTVSDVILPAASGACVVVTTKQGALDVCIANRTDHMHMSRVMTGVPCRMALVHRLECDHQLGDLPSCETYPADEGRGGRLIDYYDHCTETHLGEMAACTMATLAHSWCYVAQWRGCYSFFSVIEQDGPAVEAMAVPRVHTRLTVAVNGSLASMSEGESAEVAGVTVTFVGTNAAPRVPPLLWLFNGTYYVPTLATEQFSGPFQCIRDASGRFTYDRSSAEVHVRSVGLAKAFSPPEMFIRDDNTLRALETFAGCGCTGARNETLTGCQCGQVFLRLMSTGHAYVGREATVVSANVERVECLTVDRFVMLYVQVTSTTGGVVRTDSELCTPRVFAVERGTTAVAITCRRESDALRLVIGSIPVGVTVACRVAEAILDTPFKLVPYIPEVSSEGLPALTTDFWAALLSRYLWAIALVSGAVLFLLVLPLLVKIIKLIAMFVDRTAKQLPVKRD